MSNDLIWVIEDDQMYRDTLVGTVRHFCPGAEIREFSTEHDAEEAIKASEEGIAPVPGLVICDVMLPYAFAEEGRPVVPEEWDNDRFREAGVRLWNRFREAGAPEFKRARWVYHTVLQPKTIRFDQNTDERTFYLGKDRKLKELGEILECIFGDIDERWDATDEDETEWVTSNRPLREALLENMNRPLHEYQTSLE